MSPYGKEHCILAQDDLQHPATHREVHHMPATWKVTTNHRHYSGTASFPMAHIGDRYVLLEKMDFLIVSDVFSKYFLVRKLPNSISAAICAEHLCHISRSDYGPCYNSKEFQQFLQ